MSARGPIGKGTLWGGPSWRDAELEVVGDDADLVRALAGAATGVVVAWQASTGSDLARAVGIAGGAKPTARTEWALPVDTMELKVDQEAPRAAVNMVVIGTAPDRLRRTTRTRALRVSVDDQEVFTGRATGLVVANGEFLRGHDVVPRGHPGDERIELQVHAVPPAQRRELRARLDLGRHVPHPDVMQKAGRSVTVEVLHGKWPLEVDGHAAGRVAQVVVDVVPGRFTLLV